MLLAWRDASSDADVTSTVGTAVGGQKTSVSRSPVHALTNQGLRLPPPFVPHALTASSG